MADIAFTANLIRPLPGAVVQKFVANSTNCTPGKAVYIRSDGKVEVAQSNAAGTTQAIGVVVSVPAGKTTVAAGDTVDVCVFGPIAGWTTLTPGTLYYVSAAAAGALADTRPGAGNFCWQPARAIAADRLFVLPFTDTVAAL